MSEEKEAIRSLMEKQEVVDTVFVSTISDKGSIALLGTGSARFCQEDAKQAVAGIPH